MRVNDVVGLLESVRSDWSRILLNPRNQRFGNIISWRRDQSFVFAEKIRYWQLIEAADEGQYSFQIYDGSIVQIYYEFASDGETLLSARLAYYGSPDSHATPRSRGSTFELESEITNWLRFDYNRTPDLGVLESPCHLHIGGVPRARIMTRRVPNPKQFIELLLAWCYPEDYSKHRLTPEGRYKSDRKIASVHNPSLAIIEEAACLRSAHIFVPGEE